MTVSNETARTSAVGTNVAGQEVPFSFPIIATSEIVVKTRVTATAAETTLTETTDYTVSINGDTGGTVTLVAALATTSECWILRNTAMTQTLDLVHGGPWSAEDVEDALDKTTKLAVNNADKLNRALVAPDTDPSTLDMTLPDSVSRASQYLAFDASGEPTVVASVAPATATITTWAETLLDDANVAAGLVTLGLTIGTDVQAWDDDLDDLAALAHSDGNVIVSDGTNWTVESGATLRTSIGCPSSTEVAKITEVVSYDNDTVFYDDEVVVYDA